MRPSRFSTRILALTTATGALAGAVQAQTVTPLTVKDGAGASQPLCEYKPDGANLAGCTVTWVWTGAAWVLAPTGAGAAAGAPRTVVAQDSTTVAGSSSLPAGSNLVGKFGIDQTTPGVTNAVQATNFPAAIATGAGAAGASSPRYTLAQDSSTLAGSPPGAAGSPSSQVVTVQGAPGMTALASKPQDSGGGDATDPTNHAVMVEPQTNGRFSSGPVSITGTSLTTLVAAPGASLYSYVTDLDCSNHGTYTFTLTVSNAAATALYSFDVPAGGGWVKGFVTPLAGNGQMSANTAISVQASGGTGNPNIICNVQGRKSAN